MDDDFLKCGRCGASHINELRDGRDLVELAIVACGMDRGHGDALSLEGHPRVVVCASCINESGLAAASYALGFPGWYALGFMTERDALECGWDPARPLEYPEGFDAE